MEPPGRSCINLKLLPMKAHYFFFNAGTGAITPYLATYGRQLGLSSILVGYVLSLSPLSAMVSKLIFGGISDRYMKLRFLFLLFQVISTFALLGVHFIPEAQVEVKAELHCSQFSFFKVCKPNLGNSDSIYPSDVNDVRCKMICDFSSPGWEFQLCNHWNSTMPCSKNANNLVPFYGEILLNRSDVESNCAYLRASKFMSNSSTEQITTLEHPFCDSSLLKSNCTMDCDNPALMELLQPVTASSSSSKQFIWFLLLTLIAWASMENTASLGDTICFGVLGAHGNKYGEQRVWGAIGWGASTFITGALIDKLSGDGKKDYSIAFYLMLVNMGMSILVSYFIKYTQSKMSRSILWDVRKVLVDRRVIMFIVCCIVMGMCTGLLWSFLFWHLEVLGDKIGSERKWIKLLQGLTAGVQCLLGELPLFFLSGRIIKKIGHVHSLSVVLLAMALRLFLYAILIDPWWVLPIELLQGFTFGLFYATMVTYGSMVAPPGTETTMQGLVGACFGGIGVALGSMISGWLYSAAGGSVTFAVFSVGSLICCVAHLAVHFSSRQYATNSDGSRQSASYASPSDAVFITDSTDVM